MKKILIYNGPGTESTDILLSALNDFLNKKNLETFQISFVSADLLCEEIQFKNTKLLVIPGGRDLPYVEHLKPQAMSNIKKYVYDGGSYFGICAGAYFSCSHVSFDENGPFEVLGERSLSFFQGLGKGPVYPGFRYDSTAGSRMSPLICSKDLGFYNSFAYFNGGGEFIPMNGVQEFKTLAFYKDFPDKRAIVYINYGRGRVMLSFVHPEMNCKFLCMSNYTTIQWKDMICKDHKQSELFNWMISKLIIE